MIYYTTLDEAKAELKASSAIDDAKLSNYINLVSRRIDLILSPRRRRPVFGPYQEQRIFMVNTSRVSSWDNTFNLKDNLLSITSVVQNTTDITASVEVWPPDPSPYRQLRLTTRSKTWYDNCPSDSSPLQIKVTGAWGIHNDYANAWLDYDDLAADVTASATTGTTDDVDGADPFGFTPRFSRGSFLRIGTEWLETTDTNTTTDTLTWRRGVHGSTAAAHSTDDDVEVWQTEDPIRRIVTRQAAMLYARRGAFQVETLDGVGAITYPQDLLVELLNTLSLYSYG